MDKKMENNLNPLEQLTKLQEELGYVKGNISPVALLGLVGEAGEVLNETSFVNFKSFQYLNEDVEKTVSYCEKMDDYKKAIRKSTPTKTENLLFVHEVDFTAELADCFYYLNILATNLGLTINDLANMAHNKIRTKQAAGGSSEDRKQ